jgi:uncharacterized RDD family membrane protein YckC
MTPPNHCLECNAPLTAAETQGLCARCLLKLGLASQLAAGSGVPASPANSGPPPIMPFQFGEYRIERLLGKGGMGAVYEAEDLSSGRRVALKALGHSLDSPETRKRFLREGRLAASINHPNSVYVYGTEEIEGAPVITMEVIAGGTLQERVKAEGPMPVAAAVDAILQVIAGLEAAHAVGILHRDIKPSNCFIDASGLVKVGDFGLSISTTSRGDSALTMAGSVLGTPEFSSPEQLRGESLDLRADIYSVGMTLYYLLTGRTAFQAANVVQLLATVLEKPAPSPRTWRPEVSEELARIVLRCLAKQAGDRFKNYDELRRALLPFHSTAPTPAGLGRRFVAGVCDNGVMMLLTMPLSFLFGGGNFAMSDPAVWNTPEWLWRAIGVILLEVAYFAVLEGLWGASAGKALMGLRVGDRKGNPPGIQRAALRAVIYLGFAIFIQLPSHYLQLRLHQSLVIMTPGNIALGIGYFGYFGLLAATARRRNGFATVIDLLTKTRVTQKSAYDSRAPMAQVEAPVAATTAETLPRIGPYHVLATLATNDESELLLGYDTRLLRRVWIRRLPVGTAPVGPAARKAARATRLRWLHGHRDETSAWDAYEAAPGTPLVNLLTAPQPWRDVRHWLLDVSTELAFAAHDGSSVGVLSLDRIWITTDGRAKLLDFPAPGAVPGAEPITESAIRLTQVAISTTESAVFLNQLAISTLEGRMASASDACERDACVPLPIAARDLLAELVRQTPDLTNFAVRLQPLTRLVPDISRRRRFGLIAGCVAPALFYGVMMFLGAKEALKWEQQSPEVMPLSEALMIREDMAKGILPSRIDPKTGLDSAEIYIAGRFGDLIRNPRTWSSTFAAALISPRHRADAARIVAAHPHPTPEEMESAGAVLAPALDAQGNLRRLPNTEPQEFFSPSLAWTGVGGAFIWAAFFSVAAALLFRGGVLLRAFGIAVVRRDGSDASRLRMLWRACVAWSWLPPAFYVCTEVKSHPAAVWIVVPVVLGLVVWSALRPGRSLQDLIAGTWLVPR